MKIIYEFDSEKEDDLELEKFYKYARDFWFSLKDIEDYVRPIWRGKVEMPPLEEVLERIQQILTDSHMYEIN